MGIFRIEIKASGGNGCDRRAGPGDKLYARCKRLDCVDCLTQDFVQMLRQKSFTVIEATFTHNAGAVVPGVEVVDNVLTNTRLAGQFRHASEK